jgi:hypothetical protein
MRLRRRRLLRNHALSRGEESGGQPPAEPTNSDQRSSASSLRLDDALDRHATAELRKCGRRRWDRPVATVSLRNSQSVRAPQPIKPPVFTVRQPKLMILTAGHKSISGGWIAGEMVHLPSKGHRFL